MNSDIIKLINTNKVLIIVKNNCKYCDAAKNEFNKLNIPFATTEFQEYNRDILYLFTNGHKTFPQIFINGKFIGGHDSLLIYIMTNKLFDMLQMNPVF